MTVCLVLLQLRVPHILSAARVCPLMTQILDLLDYFNHLAPGGDKEDTEDLAWPGVWSQFVCLSVCLSVCLTVCLSVCLCVSICLLVFSLTVCYECVSMSGDKRDEKRDLLK